MSVLEKIFTTGYFGYVLVVVLRAFASVIFASAINKACKARNYPKRIWWTLSSFVISPFWVAVAFLVYSRVLEKVELDFDGKLKARSALIRAIFSFLIYFVSLGLLIVSMVTMGISGIIGYKNGELVTKYYDMNGVGYSTVSEVPLYDRDGKKYIQSTEKFYLLYNHMTDEDGNLVHADNCFVDEDGYFCFIEDPQALIYDEKEDKYFDANGKMYASIGPGVYFDENGDLRYNSPKNDHYVFIKEDIFGNKIEEGK